MTVEKNRKRIMNGPENHSPGRCFIKRHPPNTHKGKYMEDGIVDLTKVCYPDDAVTDGVVALGAFAPPAAPFRIVHAISAGTTLND